MKGDDIAERLLDFACPDYSRGIMPARRSRPCWTALSGGPKLIRTC